MAKQYLNVAYKDRELAKKLGAKWDPSVRRWYCPAGSPLSKIFSWRQARHAEAARMAETHMALMGARAANQSTAKPAAPQQPSLNFDLPLAS